MEEDGTVKTIAGNGSAGQNDGYGPITACIHTISGIAADAEYVYFAEQANRTIRRVHLASQIVSLLVGCSTAGNQDGAAGVARFNGTEKLDIDGAGQLVLAESSNCDVRRILNTGQTDRIVGNCSNGSADNANALSGSLAAPVDVCVRADGGLVIIEPHGLRMVTQIVTPKKQPTDFMPPVLPEARRDEHFAEMLDATNGFLHDVAFLLKNEDGEVERLSAHRCILAAGSPFFRLAVTGKRGSGGGRGGGEDEGTAAPAPNRKQDAAAAALGKALKQNEVEGGGGGGEGWGHHVRRVQGHAGPLVHGHAGFSGRSHH